MDFPFIVMFEVREKRQENLDDLKVLLFDCQFSV